MWVDHSKHRGLVVVVATALNENWGDGVALRGGGVVKTIKSKEAQSLTILRPSCCLWYVIHNILSNTSSVSDKMYHNSFPSCSIHGSCPRAIFLCEDTLGYKIAS